MKVVNISRASSPVTAKGSSITEWNSLPRVKFYKHWHKKLSVGGRYSKMSEKARAKYLEDRMKDYDYIVSLLGE